MSEPLSAERLRELHRRCSDCYADYCEFDHDEWPCDIIMALDSLEATNVRLREQAEALAGALRNQGLLQNTYHGTVWHIHDCPASFDFAECNYRCRVAREGFALAGTEPYVSQETRRDTEVYE